MDHHKFVQLFNAISYQERKKFRSFLKKQNPGAQQLHDLLTWFLRNIDKLSRQNYQLEDLHYHLYSQNDADTKKTNNLLSKAYIALRDFLINERLDVFSNLKTIIMLETLRQLNAYELFNKEYKALDRSLDNYLRLGQWASVIDVSANAMRFYFPQVSTSDSEDLVNAWTEQQIFSEIMSLKFSIAALNRLTFLEEPFLAPIAKSAIPSSQISDQHPLYAVIKCLRLLHQLYQEPSLSLYQENRKAFFEHLDHLPFQERNQILRYLINIGIERYKNGEIELLKEIYALYQFGIKSEVLLFTNDFSSNTFINILDISTMMGDIAFAESAFKSLLEKTVPEEQECNQFLGQAFIAFAKKDYKTALIQLQKTPLINIFVKIKVQELKLRICYETHDMEELFDSIQKFKGMMKRAEKQAKKSLFEPYNHFLKLLSKLAEMPQPSKKELTKMLKSLSPIANLYWLNQKIEQLDEH